MLCLSLGEEVDDVAVALNLLRAFEQFSTGFTRKVSKVVRRKSKVFQGLGKQSDLCDFRS